jgi:NADPH:quinone reductase
MRALLFDAFGSADVLYENEFPDPQPAPGEVLVRTRAIGLNFADIYRRRGNYHLVGSPPYILGYEAAGEIVALGAGVADLTLGSRVGFADSPFANAELVAVARDKIIPLPADVSFELAAALLLQGLTAHYLCNDSHDVRSGETVLVHAAAGGVGQLLVQVAKSRGARVFGLTSSEEKRVEALALGAEQVLRYDENWVERLRELTGGRGLDVVYDSVGSTLRESLEVARDGGHVVFFGMAGGDPAPVDPRFLMDASKTLTGGDLWTYLSSRAERERRASELFALLRSGAIKPPPIRTLPLAEGKAAHLLLESRQSVGKILLIP